MIQGLQFVPPVLVPSLGNVSVAEMTLPGGEWNWQAFETLLPCDVLLRIAAAKAPCISDYVGWECNVDSRFSVRSAYMVRWGISIDQSSNIWTVIHKFQGLPPIKVFLWLVCRNKLMANAKRV
ncbi:hypothetical protein GQ457_18G016860 [Hibiscus cannabinus]